MQNTNPNRLPKLVMLTFQDARERMYQRRKSLVEEETAKSRKGLIDKVDLTEEIEVRFSGTQREIADQVNRGDSDACIVHVPTWVNPNMVITVVNQIDIPMVLLVMIARIQPV